MSPQDLARTRPAGAPSVGAVLAAARARCGLTADAVADALRVRVAVVEGIERDDYALCGGDVYARGHVRAYARLVRLDEQALLHAYAERRAAVIPAVRGRRLHRRRRAGALRGPVAPLPRTLTRRRLERSWGAPSKDVVAAVALTALIVVLAIPVVTDLRAPGRPAREVAAPAVVSPKPTAPATRTAASAPNRAARPSAARPAARRPAPASSAATTTPPLEGVALALRATERSWVAVRDASGRTVFSGLLGKGDRKRFKDADKLRVVLGNAGGVQLTVNGRRVGAAGRTGEVKRLTIRPGDPA